MVSFVYKTGDKDNEESPEGEARSDPDGSDINKETNNEETPTKDVIISSSDHTRNVCGNKPRYNKGKKRRQHRQPSVKQRRGFPDGSESDKETKPEEDASLKEEDSTSPPNHITNENNFRWYWKNRLLKIWEEFDQENKSKLNNKYLKRKTFAHVLVDDVW
ncbi:uncharacterized protein [Argopecten irradians]|uniref:uncharacterized protein isoform X1 n=1 Tax=Argopecten irradians TaxID=31199 RepID=UPI003712C589